jgi:hypothetical protein
VVWIQLFGMLIAVDTACLLVSQPSYGYIAV